jgi:hypothetical protein
MAFIIGGVIHAEDLKTISGRVYKNAVIIRAEPDGLIVSHKFGVVKIPMAEVSPESRRDFNPAKAQEAARQLRRQELQRAADRAEERAEKAREQRAMAKKAAVDVDEQDQAEAEALEAKIRLHKSDAASPSGKRQRFRLRGEVIGVGADCILVSCESDPVSQARRELASLKESPFSVHTPVIQEVLVVTGTHKSLGEGDAIDLTVEPAGTRENLRTQSGAAYHGRFRVFHALE